SPKWAGRCPSCQAWNSLVETAVPKRRPTSGKSAGSSLNLSSQLVTLSAVATDELPRLSSGFDEADRVLGGGIVPGSVVLIGGEPGIGKSTLLLQIILNTGGLYISAEESSHQVKMRADRMGSRNLDKVKLLSTNNIDRAIAAIETQEELPSLV